MLFPRHAQTRLLRSKFLAEQECLDGRAGHGVRPKSHYELDCQH